MDLWYDNLKAKERGSKMPAVCVRAYAKINLYLKVTGKRHNGYHDLITLMQSVSLYDTLTVERTQGEGILLDTGGALPADDSNLICRAAKHYFAYTGKPFGISVKLQKSIPMAAGMGGGSADAAATLRALHQLDGERLTQAELCALAAEIGADVPFCFMGGTRLCRGIGEIMEPVENRLQGHLVVAIGGEGVSTPLAFSALDQRYDHFRQAQEVNVPGALLQAMREGNLDEAAPHFKNMFEEVIEPLRPAVARWKEIMKANGAAAAMMSGSGPSVWGMFADLADAQRAKNALLAAGARAFTCEMIKSI